MLKRSKAGHRNALRRDVETLQGGTSNETRDRIELHSKHVDALTGGGVTEPSKNIAIRNVGTRCHGRGVRCPRFPWADARHVGVVGSRCVPSPPKCFTSAPATCKHNQTKRILPLLTVPKMRTCARYITKRTKHIIVWAGNTC